MYSELIAEKVVSDYGIPAVSFNNSYVRIDAFHEGVFEAHNDLKLLFVGRNQARKRLELLIELVVRNPDVRLRLIGPGMDSLNVPNHILENRQIEVFGKKLLVIL